MKHLTRRDFLRNGTTLAAAAAVPARANFSSPSQDTLLKIKRYKPFGNTGWMVGDISSGYGQKEPGMIHHIVDRGINLIDTAVIYSGHEDVLGKAIEARPEIREKLFIVDKWLPELVTPIVTKEALLKQIDEMLARLKTTYIDCLMIHAIGHPYSGDITRIQNPAIYEAYDEAKRMGKIKFTGASSCGPNALEEFHWGVDNDKFDVIILGGNYLTKGAEPLLKKARAKGVATIAMKTMTLYKSDLNIRSLQNEETNARREILK